MEILRTKLYRPRPPEKLLERRRLLQQLEEGLKRPITIISAPAGYGKTMLVSSWLAQNTHPACWVSLDSADNDYYLFLAYLIAAIQSVYPETCHDSASLLRGLDPPPKSILQTHLINDLDVLPNKIIIVLDDYHHIRSPEIHSFIMSLADRMPSGVHLLISTRQLPPFPMAVWRARQQMNEISTRDLRFTDPEADQFLKNSIGNLLPAELITVIQAKAEGWIAGLQLAAFSSKNAIDPVTFVKSFQKYGSESIREFLLDQAFSSQSKPIQEFLIKTSILERFSAPLCNALEMSGESLRNTQDSIDILRSANLFIVPMDEQGEWFRYHNLFAEMLQRRLKSLYDENEILSLHRKAAEWFEKHDYIDDAIHHALMIDDQIYAAEIVEKHMFDALNREKIAIIDRWLALLPAGIVDTRPRLMIVRAWIESYHDYGLSGTKMVYLQKAQTMFDQFQAEFDHETRILLDGYLSALWPLYLINVGKFDLGIELGEHALDILPSSHYFVRGRALMGWALSMQASGRGNEAVRYLLIEQESHPEVNAFSLVILQVLASNYAMGGKLDELEQTALSLYENARANGYQILTGWGLLFLGLAAYIGNDLSLARQHFRDAASLQYLISKSIVRESLVGLSLVSQALGDFDEAQDAISRLYELEGNKLNEYQRSLQARLALNRNDISTARCWSLTDSESLPFYLLVWLELSHFTQTRIWASDGSSEHLAKAVALLSELIKIAEGMGSVWRVIESLIWLACALYRQGKRTLALEKMGKALQLASPKQFVQLFIEAGPLAEEILRQVDSNETELLRQIMTAFSTQKEKDISHPLLTHREIEVLRLLAEHLSEREIALRLSISLDTVKKHCYHIYNKLGVNRRRDAVAVAKESGILR